MAVPEHSVLELLYEAGNRQSLEKARNLFDGLHSPRTTLLGEVLSCCTSVKTVRLFLTWARETEVVDVDEPPCRQHPVESETTWIAGGV